MREQPPVIIIERKGESLYAEGPIAIYAAVSLWLLRRGGLMLLALLGVPFLR